MDGDAITTRPPVVIDCWNKSSPTRTWTTVLTWNNFRKQVEYEGQTFGTKEMEFPKIESLPDKLRDYHFELAVGGSEPPIDRWKELGWRVRDSHSVSRSLDEYRNYIQGSRGELSVAKNLYTATRSGWFSCRSACYLAAGLPVVVQDTGFSDLIPTGEGLLAFSDLEQALEAVERVERDYERHGREAKRVAVEYFDSTLVLTELLRAIESP